MTASLLAPGLHGFAVHFAVALLLTSTAFFLVARLFATRSWAGTLLFAARCNLYVGVVFATLSIGSGWLAFLDAEREASGLSTMALHRSTAAIAWWLSLFAAIGVWRAQQHAPGWFVLTLLVAGSTAITVSALYGAELVYRHGIGIERPKEMPRMPVAHATSLLKIPMWV